MSTQTLQMDNIGGLQKIWPVPVLEIETFDDIYLSEIHTFTLVSGARLTPIFVERDTLKFKQEKKVTADGTWFDTKLEADSPKDRIELQKLIQTMDANGYVVIYLDNNGQYKVIGSPTEPMNFEADQDAGQIESTLNCYHLTFSRKLRSRSPFISDISGID